MQEKTQHVIPAQAGIHGCAGMTGYGFLSETGINQRLFRNKRL